MKVDNPEYKTVSKEEALQDFLLRLDHYAQRYQPIDEELESEYSFIKIFRAGEKITIHKHEGRIQSRIVHYLMSLHINPRTIYFTQVCELY